MILGRILEEGPILSKSSFVGGLTRTFCYRGPSHDIPSLTFLQGSSIIELHHKALLFPIPIDKQHLL
jgi:hypothetical protein